MTSHVFLSQTEWLRYKRHLQLPGFDENAQMALKKSKVLVVGAGGLGCPILLYLAAAGIGKIGIVDFDVINIENLHRQILYNESDVGRHKAIVASEKIKILHPFVHIEVFNLAIDYENVKSILFDYDVIVDGSDNFATRYLLNDACVIMDKPYIYGAVFQYEGQVSSFNVLLNNKRSCNYRNIYPVPPETGVIPSCAEGGVLGVLPGIIGCVQALEVIKLITGLGELIVNSTWIFDSLSMESQKINISNPIPFRISDIIPIQNFCIPSVINEIECFEDWEEKLKNFQLIDVRTVEERNTISLGGMHIPMNSIKEEFNKIHDNKKEILFYCQTGMRSKQAAQIFQQLTEGKKIVYSLKGGITSLKNIGLIFSKKD
jgi:adenylyltransferase/sulfurtransferase